MLSQLLYKIYGIKNSLIKKIALKAISKIEGGQIYSKTLRRIFKDYFDIEIGMYSHGGCFDPSHIDRFTTIGRFCSIAPNVMVYNRDHPIHFKSSHALFFNHTLNYCKKDLIEYVPLKIGNDVWVGDHAIILPPVKNIGDGAVIGAGAVLYKDVPSYAVVVGAPARVVRYRFSKETIDQLLQSQWWDKTIEEIEPNLEEYQRPYENKEISELLYKPIV